MSTPLLIKRPTLFALRTLLPPIGWQSVSEHGLWPDIIRTPLKVAEQDIDFIDNYVRTFNVRWSDSFAFVRTSGKRSDIKCSSGVWPVIYTDSFCGGLIHNRLRQFQKYQIVWPSKWGRFNHTLVKFLQIFRGSASAWLFRVSINQWLIGV